MLGIGKFFEQVKTEMKKVSWPSRSDLTTSTIVVLVSTLLMGLFIGVCDLILSRIINFLISGVF